MRKWKSWNDNWFNSIDGLKIDFCLILKGYPIIGR